MRCDATDVCLGAGAGEIERLHGEWLVLMCCDATDVRLERLPAESSVYMGNGWFGYAVMLWVITMISYYVCLHLVGDTSSLPKSCYVERIRAQYTSPNVPKPNLFSRRPNLLSRRPMQCNLGLQVQEFMPTVPLDSFPFHVVGPKA